MVKKKMLRDTVEEIFDIAIDDPAAAMMKYTVKAVSYTHLTLPTNREV